MFLLIINSSVLHFLYIASGVLVTVTAILGIHKIVDNFQVFVVTGYLIVFGTAVVILEFYFPEGWDSFIPFYRHMTGRFFALLFLGVLTFGDGDAQDIASFVCAAVVFFTAFLSLVLRICGWESAPSPIGTRGFLKEVTAKAPTVDLTETLVEFHRVWILHAIYLLAGIAIWISTLETIDSILSTFQSAVIFFYLIFFGIIIIVFEFYQPPFLMAEIPFYKRMSGRGILLLFVGVLVMGEGTSQKICGSIVLGTAFATLVLRIFGITGAPSPIVIASKTDLKPLIGAGQTRKPTEDFA